MEEEAPVAIEEDQIGRGRRKKRKIIFFLFYSTQLTRGNLLLDASKKKCGC